MTIIFDGTSGTLSGAVLANTQVSGTMTAAQIASVANTQITGLLTASQIASIANTQITGVLTSSQMASGTIVQVAVGQTNFNGALVQGNSYNVGSAITPTGNYSALLMVASSYLRSPYAYGGYGDYTIGPSGIGNNLSGGTATYFNFATGMNSGNLGGSTYTAATATNCSIHYSTKNSGTWGTSDTPWYGMSIGPVYGGTYWGTTTVVYYFIK